MAFEFDGLLALERMESAVLKVKERLIRATGALEKAAIAYAVVGGNAIGAWIEQVDESAVRATQDVDIAVRRADFEAVKLAPTSVGFIYRCAASIELFLDGPEAKARDAVHVVFCGEKVRAEYVAAVPDVVEAKMFKAFRVLNLDALVMMKLTSFCDKDRTHLRDLIAVGLIDATWPSRFAPALRDRLQHLLDTPDG